MPAETTISLEEKLKLYIADKFIEQNILYSQLLANSPRRDLLTDFNAHAAEVGRLAMFNENFKNEFGEKLSKYTKYVAKNKDTKKGRASAIKFWNELSDALQNHGLIIIKNRE